jgi:hypothetical protein
MDPAAVVAFFERRVPREGRVCLQKTGHPRIRDAILNHHTWLLRFAHSLMKSGHAIEDFGPSARWLEVIAVALREDRLELTDSLPAPPRVPLAE